MKVTPELIDFAAKDVKDAGKRKAHSRATALLPMWNSKRDARASTESQPAAQAADRRAMPKIIDSKEDSEQIRRSI
jgi:hypothetical protein